MIVENVFVRDAGVDEVPTRGVSQALFMIRFESCEWGVHFVSLCIVWKERDRKRGRERERERERERDREK